MDLAVGLDPGHRFRCAACGNLTRFDVEVTERVRRYWHVDLAGSGHAEDEEALARTVERVSCRWCASEKAIEVIPALTGSDQSQVHPAG